tara:strand:- start:1101 stop:1250 length:150 start_codon:yes stop_codon:yes gene_type:complete
MLNEIITLLKYSKGTTKNIKIAKGSNKLPNSFMEAYKQFKQEIKWQSKK